MLINPNARHKNTALQNVATDPFDRPVPGQSLTGEPNKWAWEKPPQITNVDEALVFVMDKLQNSPQTQKNYDKIITMGMPIESITNTIALGGFIEGLWSVDVLELLKPPLMASLMLYTEEKQLPFVPFNNDKPADYNPVLDEMDDYDFFATMAENNPDASSKLKVALDEAALASVKEKNKMEDMKNSFLVVSMDKEKEEVLDNE
jgi:hypothetical protein